MYDETIEVLTEKMIKENFKSHNKDEEKYIITKQDLYRFSIKLIKLVKEVYEKNDL